MSDHGTFSAVVDDVVRRSNRPDRRNDIAGYVRATIRECLVQAFFKRDFAELAVTVVVVPHVWTVPSYFRQLAFVQYPYYDTDGLPIFGKEKSPMSVKREDTYWYYRAGNDIVFAGLEIGTVLNLGYFRFNSLFQYYQTETDRPATFDVATGLWTYHANYAATAILQETARNLVSTWLLFDWFDAIVEGALAKTYKQNGDPRAASSFGLYKSYQKDILAGEANTTVI